MLLLYFYTFILLYFYTNIIREDTHKKSVFFGGRTPLPLLVVRPLKKNTFFMCVFPKAMVL